MRDTLTSIAPIRIPAGPWLFSGRENVVIVISTVAARLAEKKALSRRDWRTTNANE
jgi:hypothetical protein